MALFLVRHAPTAANHGKVFQGQLDVPAVPIEDPESHAIPLTAPRTIHCSPLVRAVTAAEVLFPGEPVTFDPRLMERSVGAWQGLTHAEVEAQWPGTFVDGVIDPFTTPPEGESVEQLLARVRDFLREVDRTGDVYVVTHNGWIRGALHLAGEVAFEDLFSDPVPFLTPITYAP